MSDSAGYQVLAYVHERYYRYIPATIQRNIASQRNSTLRIPNFSLVRGYRDSDKSIKGKRCSRVAVFCGESIAQAKPDCN